MGPELLGAPVGRAVSQGGRSVSLGIGAGMIPRCVSCPFLPSGSRAGMGDQEVLVLSALSLPAAWLLPARFSHHTTSSAWTLRSFLQTLHVTLLRTSCTLMGIKASGFWTPAGGAGLWKSHRTGSFFFQAPWPPQASLLLSPSCHKPLTLEPDAITARPHSGWNALKCKGLSADLG